MSDTKQPDRPAVVTECWTCGYQSEALLEHYEKTAISQCIKAGHDVRPVTTNPKGR